MAIQDIIVTIPMLLLAVVIHECAHGWTAYKLGDPTAKSAGRLTLNPLPHIDPIGTIVLPLLLIVTRSSFLFGWAKPVPINPYYFSNPKKGMLLVGVSGPASNFSLALIMALLLKLFTFLPFSMAGLVPSLLSYGVFINIVLGVINMVPIPPLDGSRVLSGLLPDDMARAYSQIEPIGMFIILALFATGLLQRIIWPIIIFIVIFIQILLGIRMS